MTTNDVMKKLSEPFGREKVKQKRGQAGRTMSYISHGLVTERLNEVDPNWSSEVLSEHIYTDENGRLHCEGVTLQLTVNGVSRAEAGGPQRVGTDEKGRVESFANEIKNAYSDALKRAAMRFGVALEMWESLVDSEHDEDYEADAPVSQPSRPQPRDSAPSPARSTQYPQNNPHQPQPVPQTDTIAPVQITAITSLAKKLNVIVDDRVLADFEKGSLALLTKDEAGALIGALDKEWALEQAAVRQQKQMTVVGSAGADTWTR